MTETETLQPSPEKTGLSTAQLVAGILTIVVVITCARLAMWQFGRHAEVTARNDAVEAHALEPITTGSDALDLLTTATTDDDARWRRVELRGQFLPDETVYHRNRAFNAVSGVHMVTPLLIEGTDNSVLVDRGFIAGNTTEAPDSQPGTPDGRVSVLGYIRVPLPTDGFGAKDASAGQLDAVFNIDPARLDEQATGDLTPRYLQLVELDGAIPQTPRPPALPPADNGPHLGYAMQWIVFGIIAPVTYLIWLRTARRHTSVSPS